MNTTPASSSQSANGLQLFLRSPVGAIVQMVLVAVPVLFLPTRVLPLSVIMAVIALLLIWLSGESWTALGFGRPPARLARWVTEAVVAGLLTAFVATGLLTPFLNLLLNIASVNLAHKGEWGYYISNVILFGVVQTLAKGLAYRAFLLSRLETLFGRSQVGLGLTITVASILFGLSAWRQGLAGMITAAVAGAVFNLLFYWSQRNIWPTIVANGVYNTTIYTLIFLGRL